MMQMVTKPIGMEKLTASLHSQKNSLITRPKNLVSVMTGFQAISRQCIKKFNMVSWK